MHALTLNAKLEISAHSVSRETKWFWKEANKGISNFPSRERGLCAAVLRSKAAFHDACVRQQGRGDHRDREALQVSAVRGAIFSHKSFTGPISSLSKIGETLTLQQESHYLYTAVNLVSNKKKSHKKKQILS